MAREKLSQLLFNSTIEAYQTLFNPLGLIDDTTEQIQSFDFDDQSLLEGIYENLSAIYRYQYGDSQLEIIWDGKSHHDKFTEDWTRVFCSWTKDLTTNRTFVKGILQLTVFNKGLRNSFFVSNYIKAIINEYFDLKVLKRNGRKRLYVKMRHAV